MRRREKKGVREVKLCGEKKNDEGELGKGVAAGLVVQLDSPVVVVEWCCDGALRQAWWWQFGSCCCLRK